MRHTDKTWNCAFIAKKYGWIIVILAGLIPYLNSFNGDFAFDDIPLVRDDETYESSSAGDCWKRTFWREEISQGLYRPITTFSYWLNIHTSGKYSPAFRTFNIILNIAVSLVLLALLRRIRLGHAISVATAAIYALHPLHTEAVIPAFGRAEMLCALFVFAGLYFHTFAKRHFFANFAAGICVLFSFWSKEHGIILIPLCLIYDFFSHKNSREKFITGKSLSIYLIYVLFFIPSALSRISVTGGFFPHMKHFDSHGDNILVLCDPLVRFVTAVKLQGMAVLKFIFPATLSHDYSYAQILPSESVMDIGFIATVLLASLAILAMISYFRRERWKISMLLVFYIISVLPTANIITPTGTIFAERLFYLSSAWLCAIFMIVIREFSRGNFRFFLCISVIISLLLGARTWTRSEDWADQMSLCIKGTETSPLSYKTWNNLAVQLAENGSLEEAVLACDKSLKIYPDCKTAIRNRGFYNIKLGRFTEAQKDLEKIAELGSQNPEVYNKLGAILANNGEFEKAKKSWLKSLEIFPNQPIIKDALQKLELDIIEKDRMQNPK